MRPRGLESKVPSRAVTVWPSSCACHTTMSPTETSRCAGVKCRLATTTWAVAAVAGRGETGPIRAATSADTADRRHDRPLISTVLPETGPNLTAGPTRAVRQPVPSKGDGAHGVESLWKRPTPLVGRTYVTTTEPRRPGLQDPGQKDGGVGTTVVLDTCVLLADPDSLYAFGDADIVIPLTVIEELDGHKNRPDDVGRAARHVVRDLERLRVDSGGDFREPVPLPTGGTMRLAITGLVVEQLAAHGLNPDKADNRILAAALGLTQDDRTGRVKVVSADAALR